MRIQDSSFSPRSAGAGNQPVASAKANAPVQEGDRLSVSASPLKVITFNAGSDDGMKCPQEPMVQLAPFQDVIQGKADAPIIACQEAGPELAKKLQQLAKESGNFTVVSMEKSWLPNKLDLSPINTQNLVLVPKRYKVEHSENHAYGGRLSMFFHRMWGWITGKNPANAMLLAIQRRGYQTMSLKDTTNNKTFSLINTHIAYDKEVRAAEEPQFLAAIKKAEAKGPVVVTGDFNTPTLDTAPKNSPAIQEFWKNLEPAQLTDMGPKGADGISEWAGGQDIDHVLAKGFTSESSHMMKGQEMSFPGRPDAKDLSDHYAEEDVINFNQ